MEENKCTCHGYELEAEEISCTEITAINNIIARELGMPEIDTRGNVINRPLIIK